ncbi:hypothetical protein [Parasitella parasitica]|uniref:Protein kinase domain-containing protein n=1 Tax=Parasitella parasitica TaxID=35722 RepID=A0A0B7N444_9FUNG|nr:hypothetical protein [Parasitella parasitica]
MTTHSRAARLAPSLVIETLGAKTSEMHLGVNTLTNKQYAIKEFSKSRLRRREQMAKIKRGFGKGRGGIVNNDHGIPNNSLNLVRSEVAILKKLNHRNVIKLFEVLDDPDEDSLYMVMEMAHKGVIMQIDLNKPATPYTESVSRYYFRQMVLGIEYLHYNDIVHKDIKPDNILLSDNNILKIVDFGVSEMFIKGDDVLKSTAGSPAFMPPELCSTERNRPVSGKAADICIRYSKNLSNNLVDLLQKILEKNPDARITMHNIRNHAWVTNNGQEPLLSVKDNCHSVLSEITKEDIRSAITPVRHIFTVMQAVARFKRHSRSSSSNSICTGGLMNVDQQHLPLKKNFKIDNQLSIQTIHDDPIEVIKADANSPSLNRIEPMDVERTSPPPESSPGGIIHSTFSSTVSSNSSIHTPN